MELKLNRETDIIASNMPIGKVWNALRYGGTKARELLKGLSHEGLRAHDALTVFRQEIIPDETIQYLDEWEIAVGIPDDCFSKEDDVDIRRRNLLIKLASLGVQTEADFVGLAALFGIVIEVNSGIEHMPVVEGGYEIKLPTISGYFSTVLEARMTLVIIMTLPSSESFIYDYPIPFSSNDRKTMECLFTKLKPANCDIYFDLAP